MIWRTLMLLALLAGGPLVAAEKIPGTDLEQKYFELKIEKRDESTRTLDVLERSIERLNALAGSYPPRFQDEGERQQAYVLWADLLSDAIAYEKAWPGDETAQFFLIELFRMGYNMDVLDTGERVLASIKACLTSHPESVRCHFGASYFYLSVGPRFTKQAEASLDFLRGAFAPEQNADVESGYVFLYLYRQDVQSARKQIDRYVELFPDTPRAAEFANLKSALGETIEVVTP